MGSVNQLDLSLSSTTITTTLKPSYVPKTITNLLNDLADIDDVSKKMTVLNEYLCQHMEELSSVEFFKRKLPQCMLLLLDAIEVIKDEILKLEKGKESATESSTSAAERYFSEFLLRKRSEHTKMTEETKYQASSSANLHQAYDEEDEGKEMEMMEKEDQEGKGKEIMEKDDDDENDNDDDDDDDDDESGGLGGGSAGRRGDEQREYPRVVIRSKRPDGDNKNRKLMKKNIIPKINENYPVPNEPLIEQVLFPEPDDPCWRNMSRRYWTPHLHATFLDALDVLGGPEVATPKQIRELMHIEDLTNDQVKSHLQKHRLHNRGLLHQHATNCNDHMAGPHYNWEPGTDNRGHWIPGASQLNYRPRQPPARRNAGAYNGGGNGMEIDEIRISDGSGWFPNFKRSMGPDA